MSEAEDERDEKAEGASLLGHLDRVRDRLVHEAATNLIRIGKEVPGLKKAGYWLYGTATFLLPRGKQVGMLGELGETVLRGAQPSLRAFQTLAELGVETVINLRPESDHERKIVGQLGMRYVYLPLPALDAPSHELTLQFLDAVTNPAHGRVFFHCYHGVDRTGTMAACLRIARDGWTVAAAIDEMRAFKVHESGQKSKLTYVEDFGRFWTGLPEAEQRRVLHIPDPTVPEPAPAPLGMRARVSAFVGAFWRRLRGE